MTTIAIEPHPLLDAACFLTTFPRPLADLPSPPELLAHFSHQARPPWPDHPDTFAPVRDLLRHGGFKPTGRNKPASEYLAKAIDKGWFSPQRGINLAVDACNVVSLHSGLPISVIDADKAPTPWRLAMCPPQTRYAFNPSGQIIDLSGLVSLFDAEGPCAGPVKDSQRTKTSDLTTRTLSIIWGTHALPGLTQRALDWYLDLLTRIGNQGPEIGIERLT